MAADTLLQLIDNIEAAFDARADVVIDPVTARRLISEDIATAVNNFVIGRLTTGTVTGSTANTTIL